jgi:WD40 repeat protein
MLAVAGHIQEFVDVWDVPCRQRIKNLLPKEGHRVAFSPQGDLLATDARDQIQLWQTGTWSRAGQLPLAGRVRILRFSPDGKRLASLSEPGEATVWEVGQWTEPVGRFGPVGLSGEDTGSLDFSPDGQALVVGGYGHRLRVVDIASGNTSFVIPEAHPEHITSVAWSPKGSVIASGSGYVGGPIQLWDAASGKSLGKLEGHTSWICELVFSADGLWLYSASGDQTIRIWDVGQQRCLTTLRGNTDEVYGLALSPDGTTLASAGKDGIVAFWSALPRPQEEQPRQIELGRLFGLPVFAPDSRVLAASLAGTVSLLDLATSKEIERLPSLGADVRTVAYSPDGTLLVSGRTSGTLRVWSCAEHHLLRELGDSNIPIYLVNFRADGRRLLSVDRKGKAIWWDTLTWQAVHTYTVGVEALRGPEGDLASAVSPDGRLLVFGSRTGALHWLNGETGEVLATTSTAHRQTVGGIAFSKDGEQAASGAYDGTAAVWDPSSYQLIDAFKGHMHGTLGLTFAPDGRRLATCSVGRESVRLWDMSTRRELMTLPGKGSEFSFVAFSPDGQWLAVCGMEGKLQLRRAPSWAEIEAAEKRLESRQSP